MLNPSSSRPLYQQLADLLKDQIQTGIYPSGTRLESEPEFAVRYDIARGTVRQAMDLLVEEGLLNRIQGKGTYVASADRITCTNQVGVVVPYINDNLTIGFLNGIESVLREHRYSLIYSPSECDLNLEKEQIQHLMAEKVCGLILMPVSTSNEAALISRVLSKDIQLVVIDRAIPGWVTNGVFVDNLGGGMLAVNHLLEQGYQRVGCITEATYVSAVADRVRGYELAMRQAGLLPLAAIPLDWQHVHWDLHPPVFTLEQMLAVEQFIHSSQEPTAIFCVNDFIAIGVMKYLLAKGYKIPDDVAIAGFDDIPLAQYLPVPLTTVKQPGLEVGREAANLIISLLNDPQQTQRTIVLPTSLVIRQSTRQDYNSEVSGGN